MNALKFTIAALVASVHAYDGPDMVFSPVMASTAYNCDAYGNKMCKANLPPCPIGLTWNSQACMCFAVTQCNYVCPPGMVLDPRIACKCSYIEKVESLFECEPGSGYAGSSYPPSSPLPTSSTTSTIPQQPTSSLLPAMQPSPS